MDDSCQKRRVVRTFVHRKRVRYVGSAQQAAWKGLLGLDASLEKDETKYIASAEWLREDANVISSRWLWFRASTLARLCMSCPPSPRLRCGTKPRWDATRVMGKKDAGGAVGSGSFVSGVFGTDTYLRCGMFGIHAQRRSAVAEAAHTGASKATAACCWYNSGIAFFFSRLFLKATHACADG